jgi:hypothetical protein
MGRTTAKTDQALEGNDYESLGRESREEVQACSDSAFRYKLRGRSEKPIQDLGGNDGRTVINGTSSGQL